MRKTVVITWLAILLVAVISVFWHTEWKYNLPTPVPENYNPVVKKDVVNLNENIKADKGKPLFLHFFNPNCPCSRFNIAHFKTLVKEYGNKVDFKMVVLSNRNYTAIEMQHKFDVTIPVLFDSSVAAACGVYSTPQAVIIDSNQQLFYRGNYNRSRYCSDKKTEYAKQALDNYFHAGQLAFFDQYALKAYGCTLPKCTK